MSWWLVKLLLFGSVIGWIVYTFGARFLAWFLNYALGVFIGFRVTGCNSLRDVVVKCKKGAVESICIGEIKLSLRKSLVELESGVISRDPKLQILITDLEIVIRHQEKRSKKSTSKKQSTPKKAGSGGRGKWLAVTNASRFLSLSIVELVVKAPQATVEVKDLKLDISKDGASVPTLTVKLQLFPISIQKGEPQISCEQQPSNSGTEGNGLAGKSGAAHFVCQELYFLCEVGHERDKGLLIKNVDVASGEVALDFSEGLFYTKKAHSDAPIVDNIYASDSVKYEELSEPSEASKKKVQKPGVPKKLVSLFPEKVSFTLPKLDVKFVYRDQSLVAENNIMGIHLKSNKSESVDDMETTTTHFDVGLEFNEIHILREGSTSVMEILKLVVTSSVDVPMQVTVPIRVEVDVKIGGTRCNVILSRLHPWVNFYASNRTKKMVLQKKDSGSVRSQKTDMKAMTWTCTFSAPEMTVVFYNFDGGLIYHGRCQSSHLLANNITNKGTPMQLELQEIQLDMADGYQDSLKESLFAGERNSIHLVHIPHVIINLCAKEMESHEEHDPNRQQLSLLIGIADIGVDLNFQRLEPIISIAMTLQTLLKRVSATTKWGTNKIVQKDKPSSKGVRVLKFNLDRCSVKFCCEMGIESTTVADPKRVNYGSQGGEVIISVSADGSPRTARITSMLSGERKQLQYMLCLDISNLSLCANKDKQSRQMDLKGAKLVYQACDDESTTHVNVPLLDMQNVKFVRRPSGLNDMSVCSLFSTTNIITRWEPDVHICLHELALKLKLLLHKHKAQGPDENSHTNSSASKDITVDTGDDSRPSMQQKRRELILAVDVEMLTVSAELADGVEAMIQVQSIFSENAKIGVLLEYLSLTINEARVLRSSRMQISRIPSVPLLSNSVEDKTSPVVSWDWIIQGLDVHICMPYRLELRAVEDAVEDMSRGLKLITAAKTELLFPLKRETSKKAKSRASRFGCVKFSVRKITAEIEEEPIQGWLDEHHQLMKKEVCELAVRMKFLDDAVSGVNQITDHVETGEPVSDKKIYQNGVEIDLSDESTVKTLREQIHKQAFMSYYQVCQKITISEGSGACKVGFQAGFKPSTARGSLLTLQVIDLELNLKKIEGDRSGMIELIKSLDPVCMDSDIPFSRMYGSNFSVNLSSLVVQLRNFPFPLFSGTGGQCEGRLVMAQQATSFQPQIQQEAFIGRWRKVSMFRSLSGTTPAMKMYGDLPIQFQKVDVGFGVGFEPVFADVSYAFTVALRRANLSVRNPDAASIPQPPKKERSLPWWDDVRYYVHGKIGLRARGSTWNWPASTDPYETLDKLQIVTDFMEIQQSDGRVFLSTKDFRVYVSSLERLVQNYSIKPPIDNSRPFLLCPQFSVEVNMEWDCDSGAPLNHYLHSFPVEGKPREKVLDPFRSTSLSLRWNFSLTPPSVSSGEGAPSAPPCDSSSLNLPMHENSSTALTPNRDQVSDTTFIYMGAHDLAWVARWSKILYAPPLKLRLFSRYPRFGVPRVPRSGNLPLDKVMTEVMLRLAATPVCIKHASLADNDPANGLTFRTTKLKYELYFTRGKQVYTFDCIRENLDLAYQGLDVHMLKADLSKDLCSCIAHENLKTQKDQQFLKEAATNDRCVNLGNCTKRDNDDGFFLSSDYFTIRKQKPKADSSKLLTWQEAGKKSLDTTYVRSEIENGSDSDHTQSDASDDDDDGFNVVVADNCQRVFVYGLKLLWNIENRDAVLSWVGELSRSFESPKPSPSRQYAQRKLAEEQKTGDDTELSAEDSSKPSPDPICKNATESPPHGEISPDVSTVSPSTKVEGSSCAKPGITDDGEEEGTRHFMVNVIQPQFNLHSEEANGRFLLAAASGRVMARSFHSVLRVGCQITEQPLGTEGASLPESEPEMTWNRVEFSALLEHVQAHVAPTDVDLGAGVQWLSKIPRRELKVKRTGTLLERVFMPCTMYFRYTRHKGGTADLKVKPLKELTFNSPDITATMTSRQFQVMVDVLNNLLLARPPKPRKSSLSYPDDGDEDVGEEADEVVPDGVEEVELARIDLEKAERERKLLIDDIASFSATCDLIGETDFPRDKNGDLWMIAGGKELLVHGLKKELVHKNSARKDALTSLRLVLRKAAQMRLMEKEKNKSPSYAMRISFRIDKVVWSMLADGKAFSEVEINSLSYDFDRDYTDIGLAQFTTKFLFVRNCLPNAKSDMLLSPWNPPADWGKNVMLRVDAKQGVPKEASSPIELFQVDIYPLRIYLTETIYRMIWGYLFPEEVQDSLRRQEVWKVSTTAGTKRGKKAAIVPDAAGPNSHVTKDSEVSAKHSAAATSSQSSTHVDASQASKSRHHKTSAISGTAPELRRTSSFDRTWEENLAESIANELVLQVQSSNPSSRGGPLSYLVDQLPANEDTAKTKQKDPKSLKPGRPSLEEKKTGKGQEEKRTTRKMREFHNVKISQVELLVTYEGSRFAVSDLRLLMDTFVRDEFVGTWGRLFSRVKKHIIWGVLKSVTGMQGKKFKDKIQTQKPTIISGIFPDSDPKSKDKIQTQKPTIISGSLHESDLNLSDSDGGNSGKLDQLQAALFKKPSDGAGDGFVTSIRGLFSSQRRKAKAFVLRTMRGEGENEFSGEWSDGDADFSPYARQLTITKAKKLIRRHTKKFRPSQKGGSQKESSASSPKTSPCQSDSSGASSPREDFHD